MKWGILIFNAILFGCVYILSSTGLAVHRTHSISVAVGFVKAGTIPQSELAKVERELRSVGNADFYYRTISEVAAVGCAANALVLVTVSGSPKGNRNAEPVKVRCYVDQKQR